MIVEVKMSTERPGVKNEKIWQKVKHKDREIIFVKKKKPDNPINLNENSIPKIRLKNNL